MTASNTRNVRLRRAYDEPAPDEGYRVLVDRVWPRGRTKEQLRLDIWPRDLGPSTQLRTWFGHDPARWAEFQARYHAELAEPDRAQALDALAEQARQGPVTLVFGARDPEHNQALVIADELERRLGMVDDGPDRTGPVPQPGDGGGTIMTERTVPDRDPRDRSVGAELGAAGTDREPTALATMRATLTVLDALVRSAPADFLERRPAPDEWSPREVLGHLLYVERLLRERTATMVADDQDTPMPKGAPAPPPAAPSTSLAEWQQERGETLAWLPTLGPAELERATASPRFGRITAREQIDEWAYHDLDHLRQLLAAIESDLYPRIGGYRRLYPPPFPAASPVDGEQRPPALVPAGPG
ncbi:MAG: DUF488 family protein, N3 subclade [Candidatus Limnocylindrales bacterium]